MTALKWDETGKRFFETGVDKVVLFVMGNDGNYKEGVSWSGVTGIDEQPEGAEPNPLYADNIEYLNLLSVEELKATITAYTYPDEFGACDGTAELMKGVTIGQQNRSKFALCYRTKVGNDVEGQDKGYKIHILYGLLASPSSRAYKTVNNSPEAIEFSWSAKASKVAVDGKAPSAIAVIDSTKIQSDQLEKIEKVLYGSNEANSKILLPHEIKTTAEG